MLKIGITGGIGSGKSVVAEIFHSMGIPVYNADKEAKQLMDENPEIRYAIIQAFGNNSYENGKLNRKHIATIAFANSEKLQQLNAITHPIVIDHATKWMEQQKAPFVVKEAALIFESGSAETLDYVTGVYTPEAIRIKRVMDRDNLTREEVKKRMHNQINEEIKMQLCDFVLYNDEKQLLIPQVLKLYDKLIEFAV